LSDEALLQLSDQGLGVDVVQQFVADPVRLDYPLV